MAPAILLIGVVSGPKVESNDGHCHHGLASLRP